MNFEGFRVITGNKDAEVTSVEFDSRKIKEGSLFVAVKGFTSDGHTFIKSALEKGASVIVADEDDCPYSDEELKACGLGYRAKYVKDIAQNVCNGKFDLEKLKNLNYVQAIDYLKTQNGVGDKIANCVALFGLYKTEAFPIDVWIRRIIDTYYNGHFDASRFKDYAGIVQQYMFYYERAKEK